ncbi:hypothetical protein LHP98_10840 [Rhodobacter sp. Har01]|uniref:hypothetical protein n=1 Tax=Rhodobacter sp. Har01 TaxID=2883999 RepID=UPI001D06D688|nr:hypothetical protein [Rhodobacter sp. Har01]MCB6178625.1 hypothetical protein [Rhodobacter sp. Har01]
MDQNTLISLGLTIALMAVLSLWCRWRNRSAMPVIQADGRGCLRLPRGQLLFYVLGFFAMAVILAQAASQSGSTVLGFAALGTGVFGALVLLTTTPAYHLEWDEDGVIGPSGYGLLPVGARPVFLTWDEITSVRVDRLRSHVLTGRNRRRVVIYNAYLGKRIFLQILHAFRPDLAVTAD